MSSDILAKCESLNHNDRVKCMIDLGRHAQIDSYSLSHLSNSPYSQLLAIWTCYGSQDPTIAIQLLSSTTSLLVRDRALYAIIDLGSDDNILKALDVLPKRAVIKAFFYMRKKHIKQNLIDDLMDRISWGPGNDSVYHQILPLASEKSVKRHLDKIIDRLSTVDWSRLATYHPGLTRDAFLKWTLSAVTEQQIANVFESFVQWAKSDKTVDILLQVVVGLQTTRNITTSLRALQALLERRSREVVQFVVKFKLNLQLRYSPKILQRLNNNELLTLRELGTRSFQSQGMDKLSIEQRIMIYKVDPLALRSDTGVLDIHMLKNLTGEIRVQEARRILQLPCFEAEPSEKIPFIAMMPWDDAISLQMPFLRSSEAGVRLSVYMNQIAAAKYDSTKIKDAIKLGLRAEKEQDPVRKGVIEAFTDIPASRFEVEHLDGLATIIQQALNVMDSSFQTKLTIRTLIMHLFPRYPEWAVQQILFLTREIGDCQCMIDTYAPTGLQSQEDTMQRLSTAMSPMLAHLVEKNLHIQIALLGKPFGGLVKFWTEWLDTLEMILDKELEKSESAGYQDDQEDVLEELKKYRPKRHYNYICLCVSKQVNLAKRQTFKDYVASHCQDLLSSYLEAGKLYEEADHINLAYANRWTYRQQSIVSGSCHKLLSATETYRKTQAISQLSKLKFIPPTTLIKLSRHDTPIVAQVALRELSHSDDSTVLHDLFSAIDGPQANIAIQAFSTFAKHTPEKIVLQMLQKAPRTKITVTKEILRTAGDLHTDEAMHWLYAISKEDLHRDVRIALHQAFWSYLEDDAVWDVYKAGAGNLDPAIAKSVCDIPINRLSESAREKYLSVHTTLLSHPSAEVRLCILRRSRYDLPVPDKDTILAPYFRDLMESKIPPEAVIAAQIYFNHYSKSHPDLIRAVFARAVGDYRRILRLLDLFVESISEQDRTPYLAAAETIWNVLFADQHLTECLITLLFGAFPLPLIIPRLLDLLPNMHVDAFCAAKSKLTALGHIEKEWVMEVEESLRVHEDERARRLGLVCLALGKMTNQRKRELLHVYRKDESLLVRSSALIVSFGEVDSH